MAGGHGDYHPVKVDQAVESWAYMRENVWKHFRFTNKTSRLAIIWGVLVPFGVFTIATRQDLKWDILGAKKDDPIARWGNFANKPSERQAAASPSEGEEEE